ncbi:MAG: penicillin-binding protein 1C [Proteobacteria bacterium]|nr:penicillin-binding protein 1C [Pseudomonadota bacterium]
MRRTNYWILGIAAVLAAGGLLLGGLLYRLDAPTRAADIDFSTVVVDRNGLMLRSYATEEGRWRLPVAIEDVDPRFVDLLLTYEDKRFRTHHGVDPLALGRAAWQLITNGRIVSGGSTLTMQVARLLAPRRERSLGAKLRQIVRAIALERRIGKGGVLALYLNLAPYGGNIEGVRAASYAYFGKEPRWLTQGEAALLVALPQSPEARRPDRSALAARAARDRVLDRLAAGGRIAQAQVARAKVERFSGRRMPMPMLAPHAANQAVAAAPGRRLHRLSIDARLQKSLEDLARDRAHALGRDVSLAILAVDNASGEVIARVASADYFDDRRAGQVDMTQASRSPGSALKPFIYGLGFEDGLIHPETLIDDRPARYGDYAPANFDLHYQGTVTVRRALQMSLNVPAVAVLDRVGASRFAARLSDAGAVLALPKGEAPGLAVALGGAGIKLTDLVTLYAGIARQGMAMPLRERLDAQAPTRAPRRLMDAAAAWYVAHILRGTPPPDNAVGERIAFKTGTSYGYRDAWSVGFDGRRTIGVWVGRADGAPVAGLSGRTAAAPILFDAFARGGPPVQPRTPAPKGVLLTTTARLPVPLRRYRPGSMGPEQTEPPLRIVFPPNGARLDLVDAPDAGREPVALKIAGGFGPITVIVNGRPLPAFNDRRGLFFRPDGPGFVRVTVMDGRGKADSVQLRLE